MKLIFRISLDGIDLKKIPTDCLLDHFLAFSGTIQISGRSQ
jgi:hypothetical protein